MTSEPARPILLYDLCGADTDLRFSPACWRTRFSLAHKGLAFETVPTPFTAIPEIGGGGVSKTVPVIDDAGALIRDSFAIAEYLDDTYPTPPLFAPRGRPVARLVEAVVAKDFVALITRMMVADIHDRLAPPDQAYFRRTREERLKAELEAYQEGVDALAEDFCRACTPLRRGLDHGRFLGGDEPLFVDYIYAGTFMWLRTITGRIPLAADDPVHAWFERILDLHDGLARRAKVA